MTDTDLDLRELRGLVATVVLSGHVQQEYSQALSDLRDWNTREGLTNVEYRKFDAKLVESGRDAVVKHALKEDYDWVLMVDADAAPFPQDALYRLLATAYGKRPDSDIVGAYCQLKGKPHLPTIDTGSGTWEEWYPNSGIPEVIRTGAHFFLAKTPIFRRFGPPWFRTRRTQDPLRALQEVDNFARIKLDGRNPFREHPEVAEEWNCLIHEARDQEEPQSSHVGEDSGFCDRVKAAGGTIYVDTSVVAGHVAKKIIKPSDLKENMEERERRFRLSVGVRE